MSPQHDGSFAQHWREIARAFLRTGALSYGGPAIMGLMQAEFQERRNWVTKERFLEGLSLVNLLPGAGATQLAIFLGHARGGWRGGVLAGLCFVLPAFAIMLALAVGYAALGATVLMRGALYGLGPVVLAVFLVAVNRLGRNAVTTPVQALLAAAAALAAAFSPLGTAAILLLAGGLGLFIFHGRRVGATALLALGGVLLALHAASGWLAGPAPVAAANGAAQAGLLDLAAFFFKVGALTFGGGLTLIAFIQEQVVVQLQWLSPQEFLAGLALGQFTPGPILMVAAYVGYKAAGLSGAGVSAAAIFFPSFGLMLVVLPILNRVRSWAWVRAAMRGIGPAVIGVLGVALARLAPIGLPDSFAAVLFVGAVAALIFWRAAPVKLMAAGALLGTMRTRLPFLGTVKGAL